MSAASRPRSLQDWLRWQESLNPRAIALGLERVDVVARRLGFDPAATPTLTIGGTNGKGSTSMLAATMLREAGYRVGLYTSPHLLHYNERVQLQGEPVDDAALCRAFEAIDAARGEVPLTYFEFGTLAALWLFREAAVEVQVLEVGLGGRLDAVNWVDADVAVLTNVALDHQDWLGPDRESIGREKAGIFRRDRVAVLAEREPPVSVLTQAAAIGAPLQRLGRDYDYAEDASEDDSRWHWRSGATQLRSLPRPGLAGNAQLQNAAAAIAAVRALAPRLTVDDAALRRALPALRLTGRLQRLDTAEGPVLLDVAHNAAAMAVLVDHLRRAAPPSVVVVLGMLADKPVHDVATQLASCATRACLVGLPGPRGLTAAALAACIAGSGLNAQCCDNMAAALSQARQLAGPQGWVVVTGSFLTVAEALAVLA